MGKSYDEGKSSVFHSYGNSAWLNVPCFLVLPLCLAAPAVRVQGFQTMFGKLLSLPLLPVDL
jgi:hypothetical protein